MAKPKLRTKRAKPRKNTYFGEYHAKVLLNWLYHPATAEDHRKIVLRLIGLGRGYQDSTNRYAGELVKGEINTILCDLKFYPIVVDIKKGTVTWEAEEYGGMADAIRSWLELVSRGLLGRLKQCACKKCGKWFFARFAHAFFCSLECRDAAAKEDPVRHENRKEYERKYYHEVLAQNRKNEPKPKRKGHKP